MNYPQFNLLKFDPILKEKIWGGQKLKKKLLKKTDHDAIGESWEISEVPNNISIVNKGKFKGESLSDLIKKYPHQLLGHESIKRFGYKFPILFKFIDAAKRLSVQLHPDDALAKKRHNSFGKTEMWYIIDADPDAFIIADFNKKLTPDAYQKYLEEGTLVNHLQKINVKKGDVFYIKPGFVHAIGEGILLAEIQQTSDITYRIYDWERKDENGQYRELHTDLALDAIDFNVDYQYQINYSKDTYGKQKLLHTNYFKTDYIYLRKDKISLDAKSKFMVLMCVEGELEVEDDQGNIEFLKTGETLFISAQTNTVELKSSNARALKVTI